MSIDPVVVVAGAALCLIPVGLGLLIARWRLPYVVQREMQDEGDLFASNDDYASRIYRDCPCPMCADRRIERAISDRAAEARRVC